MNYEIYQLNDNYNFTTYLVNENMYSKLDNTGIITITENMVNSIFKLEVLTSVYNYVISTICYKFNYK